VSFFIRPQQTFAANLLSQKSGKKIGRKFVDVNAKNQLKNATMFF
jgi:hypothetical protein